MQNINDPTDLGNDLFGMNLLYNQDHVLTSNAQFNGNISGYEWKSASDGVMRNYGFEYDALNRILSGSYSDVDLTGTHDYSLSNVGYDRNGNILTLNRNGLISYENNILGFGAMDILTYGNTGNQLDKVDDDAIHNTVPDVHEFEDGNTSGYDYSYDANGNMIQDLEQRDYKY